MNTEFCLGNPKEGSHMQVIGIDKRMELNLILNMGLEGVDWIDYAQDGDKFWVVLNPAMNIWV